MMIFDEQTELASLICYKGSILDWYSLIHAAWGFKQICGSKVRAGLCEANTRSFSDGIRVAIAEDLHALSEFPTATKRERKSSLVINTHSFVPQCC